MRKWLIAIMMVLMAGQVHAIWTSADGGTNGWFAGLRAFFSEFQEVPTCTISLKYINATSCSGEAGALHNVTVYDMNWATCCQSGGECYRDDTSTNQNYYTDEIPCGEVKMWEVAVAIFALAILVTLIYVGKDWALTLFNRQETSIIKLFLYMISIWLLPLFSQLINKIAENNSATADTLTLTVTLYTICVWTAGVTTALTIVIILTKWLMYLGVDVMGTFRRGKR